MKRRSKIAVVVIVTLILLAIVNWLLVPRTIGQMKEMATGDVLWSLSGMHYYGLSGENAEAFFEELSGPLVDTTHEDYIEFKWYEVLDWGDTASISCDVWRSLSSFSWRDSYFWPRTTYNRQWSYLFDPRSEFSDVLPTEYQGKVSILSALRLSPDQRQQTDSMEMIVDPERLLFFLKEGYFELLDQGRYHTVVGFYEPIGYIFMGLDTIRPRAAEVYIDEAAEVLIVPYDAPLDLWEKAQFK